MYAATLDQISGEPHDEDGEGDVAAAREQESSHVRTVSGEERPSALGSSAVEQPSFAAPADEGDAHDEAEEPTATLDGLVALASALNPRLRRLEQETAAAWARVGHVGALPDPTVGANVFAAPIETAAGSQRANVTLAQMIPWLKRLDAKKQQAACEALALQERWRAESLSVVAEVKEAYYRVYVIDRKLEINAATRELLESLLEVAKQRVATGNASQGDLLLAALEISRLAEESLMLQQQRTAATARMNALLDRPADTPVKVVKLLAEEFHVPPLDELRMHMSDRQPELIAARLRTQASTWGIEVAALERRPNIALNAAWYGIDDNRPASSIVDVGQDAWSVGAAVSVPLWSRKNDALESEATRRHFASHAAEDELYRKYDSLLVDLREQIRTAAATVGLYRETILPQARQTLVADRQAYGQGTVEFDRVIADARNILMLQVGYHEALARLATAVAHIERATASAVSTLDVPLPRD